VFFSAGEWTAAASLPMLKISVHWQCIVARRRIAPVELLCRCGVSRGAADAALQRPPEPRLPRPRAWSVPLPAVAAGTWPACPQPHARH
jgi:hypothetical protein